ncbi:nucleotidyltransferase family protein [Desulfosarcina ovata subsp. sediminis]|uniref:Nucleotidyltransferase family protein n=1 Tax=Desulfosarcina ovata subsp. sediminis TaxID=885957 RepID=A0A5K7ZZ26_9BACT|nr:DUF294 nucleotidyltransferase-like domain-containing protein [Desulfosarcina ovata]BBO85360.1 nucleotidyltransferase family protein [Desulfosarcina ovata subsp. sediminis]
MNAYPLPGIIDFLKTVVPFNTLDEATLEQVANTIEVAFYPAGQPIIRMNEAAGGYLYIVQTGCARISITDESADELLVDLRGEGDSFGAVSLLEGKSALFNITAQEDMIALLVPKAAVDRLLAAHAPFKRYFGFSLARNFRAVRKSADEQLSLLTSDSQIQFDQFMTGKRVSDLMSTAPLTCEPEATVQQAARFMKTRGVGSIVVQDAEGLPLGILTDTDLRSQIIAEGRDLSTPVEAIMSAPIRSVAPHAFAFDALLDMSRFAISHLVVTENRKAMGILSEHDFQLAAGTSPVGMIGDISNATSIDELVGKRAHIDRVLEMAMQRSGAVKPMVALIAELNDRVTRQFIRVVEKKMADSAWGPPPTDYCWLAMGSEGRREQTLYSDQDNALLYQDVGQEDEPEVRRWFLAMAEQVVDALARFGIPRCQGGVMASNPRWCLSLEQWREMFGGWLDTPTPESMRLATVFFDFRSITDGFDGALRLRQWLTETAAGKRHYARELAGNALYNRPPIGFLRQFVVETSGEHSRGLNLKLRGLTPVVDAARVMALELGIAETNTVARLKAVTRKNGLDAEFAAAIDDAYDYINFIRISHHLRNRTQGQPLNNFVNPALLNPMERKVLKESFSIISQLQELLAVRYQIWGTR